MTLADLFNKIFWEILKLGWRKRDKQWMPGVPIAILGFVGMVFAIGGAIANTMNPWAMPMIVWVAYIGMYCVLSCTGLWLWHLGTRRN